MTPNWLQPMPWMQMSAGDDLPSTGEGIVNAAGTLGTAFMNRRRDPKAPRVAMPAVNPQVGDPAIPEPAIPAFGDNPLMRRKSELLGMMNGGGGGAGGSW